MKMTDVKSEDQLLNLMSSFDQTEGQTIYEHGLSVWDFAKRLYAGQFDGMRIPDWFQENRFTIAVQIIPFSAMKRYCIYHDCSKPLCMEVGEDGKVRFPNHASISAGLYSQIFPDDCDGAWLTNNDMALHTLKASEIEKMCKLNRKELMFSLIISAFAEVHSNAKMFGGIESNSFKMKWRKVNQRSKQIFKYFTEESTSIDSLQTRTDWFSFLVTRSL